MSKFLPCLEHLVLQEDLRSKLLVLARPVGVPVDSVVTLLTGERHTAELRHTSLESIQHIH